MSRALVECVPNFSEGRDAGRIDAIVAVMRAGGVYVLDQTMDADHNRSVVTLAGEPEAIEEAAIRGVGRAAELIDLNQHRGVHPRMGAADVVPFIPIEGVTLEDCAAMARRAGAEIWRRFGVPVYLYEAAATAPERRDLAWLRRGGFEAIREEIGSVAARRPDFGDAAVHRTAGITAVGARRFLIAWNIFLDTADVEIAKKVARAVRASSGGLACVKALGLLVDGRAQVSMNLTDFETTGMQRVLEAVREEARRLGARPESSELIGLVPRRALEGTSGAKLLIEGFNEGRILENRMEGAMGGVPARGNSSPCE